MAACWASAPALPVDFVARHNSATFRQCSTAGRIMRHRGSPHQVGEPGAVGGGDALVGSVAVEGRCRQASAPITAAGWRALRPGSRLDVAGLVMDPSLGIAEGYHLEKGGLRHGP